MQVVDSSGGGGGEDIPLDFDHVLVTEQDGGELGGRSIGVLGAVEGDLELLGDDAALLVGGTCDVWR